MEKLGLGVTLQNHTISNFLFNAFVIVACPLIWSVPVRYLFGILDTNRDQPFNSVRESQDTFNDTQRSISPVRFSREGPLIRSLDDREQSFSSNLDDRDQLLVTMSSAGGESLEEVWRMLDRPTPSPFTTPRYSGKTGTNLLLSLIVNFS